MAEYKQSDGRRQICVFARLVNSCNGLRYRRTLSLRDSFRQVQNASSRVMLVLCPPTMTERLMFADFMVAPFEQVQFL